MSAAPSGAAAAAIARWEDEGGRLESTQLTPR
jgi:hypothetical protein